MKIRTTIYGMLIAALLSSCALVVPKGGRNIPDEPTIWVVSEIYEDVNNPFPNGLVGYKLIPVNPGGINAKSTWKVDFKGKYTVGQRVDFEPIATDKQK